MKILIVKTSALGDIIHAFDALAYLRERCPFAQIDWVVEKGGVELVRAHPAIDKVYPIDSRTWRRHPFKHWKEIKTLFRSMPRYHLIFDLQGNCKSAWVLWNVDGALKIGFGKKSVPERPNCWFTDVHVEPPTGKNIRDDYLALVQHPFRDITPYVAPPVDLRIPQKERDLIDQIPRDAILVCPFAHWPNKRLPHEQLIEAIKRERGPVYIAWGSPEEHRLADRLRGQLDEAYLLPKLSLPVLQQLMAQCQKIITMDSLPLHLAGTTRTPTLSFFGPSSPQKYAPKGAHHQVIQGGCPYHQTFEKRCSRLRTCHSGACINKLKLR